jgi:uncharacterized membrane-anchored protein YhcB (DUF1043 family)
MISLEGTASTWAFGILVFVIGLVLGCIATYLAIVRYGRTRELQKELDQFKERFTDYRDQVTQHFMRTSELVQEMTQSYRAVYEHLANGAQRLCGDESDTSRLASTGKGRLTNPAQDAAGESADDLAEDQYPEDLLGDSPRISDLNIKTKTETQQTIQH